MSEVIPGMGGEPTIEITVSDMHVVDALVCETRCDLVPLFLQLQDVREEMFEVTWSNIIPVRPLD